MLKRMILVGMLALAVPIGAMAQSLPDRVIALETRADDTDTEQAVQDGRLDSIETEQGVQNGRLDGLETRADDTDTEQAVQDGRLDDIETTEAAQDAQLAMLGDRARAIGLRDALGNLISTFRASRAVFVENGFLASGQASPNGIISAAQNTFNFESVDCTGQAYANILGIFDAMNFEQAAFPLDSDGDGMAEWLGFPSGPAVSIVINSRLAASGTCISVPGAPESVSPMFLKDLRTFPTPWQVGD